MAKLTYQEQIKHPKWQKKRLEILERDNFICQKCNNENETLNIHHIWYDKNLKYWEYPDRCYITLCKKCHEELHKNKINKYIEFNNLFDEIKNNDDLDSLKFILDGIIKFNNDITECFIGNMSQALNSSINFIYIINHFAETCNIKEDNEIVNHLLCDRIIKLEKKLNG